MIRNSWLVIGGLAAASALSAGCAHHEGRRSRRGEQYVAQPQPIHATLTLQGVPPPIAIQASVAAVAPNVQLMQAQCNPNAQEQCNGIDDNCNGAIDEEVCGYQTGQIQITAAWQSGSDIDLHVVDPNGEEVSYRNTTVSSGGTLDHDSNPACNPRPPTTENVYWPSSPPRGQYQARVEAYDMCGSVQTPVTLSISVGQRVIGTWQYTMSGRGDSFTVPFTVQ
jgi:uncharacterized protein YfaP (DUF2135 family)